MKLKDILRNWVIAALSQPKNKVSVELSKIQYGSILKGARIVVTGGSKGIGFAMADKFINEGAKVVIAGRNEKDLKDAVLKLGQYSHYIIFDNSNIDGIETFLVDCTSILGGVDSLVLNAGISFHEGNFLNVTTEGFSKQLNTNLTANYFISQSFLKFKLGRNEGGSMLFVTSETAGKSNDLPYGLSKNALNNLVEGLARRVYQRGIRINAIAPGVTYTNMTKGEHQITDDYSNDSVAGRFLLPSEIAEVACFLLSKASVCINGEILYCDAGSHLKINGFDQNYSL